MREPIGRNESHGGCSRPRFRLGGEFSLDRRVNGWDTRSSRRLGCQRQPRKVCFWRRRSLCFFVFSQAALSAARVIMRNLHSNISSIVGNIIVRRGSQLIVSVEALRTLCADLSTALSYYASCLVFEASGASWQLPVDPRGMKPRVHMACCFALVKQRQWGHDVTCHHTVA
jgi:hypothetical protein